MPKKKATIAKITRPKLSGILRRERLFTLLDDGRNRPLVWISGLPGSGKTTLVSSYLDVRKLPHLWYQVDEGDTDIATVFYYLDLAVRSAGTRKQGSLPLLTPEYHQDISTFTKRYFESLYDRMRPPFVLVFDNYQTVPPDSSFHEVMSSGLSLMPAGGCTIIISRSDPPPALARIRAHEQMAIVDNNQLRLTREETSEIVRLRGLGISALDDLGLLHEKTEGWAAGLVLILELMRVEGESLEPLVRNTPEALFNYFAGEIFVKTDSGTRDFLMKTSFLPTMTAETAEKLSGLRSAGRVLDDLSRNNYFTAKHTAPRPAYQYHPLFRKFLLERAERDLSPAALARVKRTAGAVLESAHDVEGAVELMRSVGDWRGLVRALLSHAPSLVAQGRSRTLEDWLQSIPQTLAEDIPWLLYWRGACRLPYNTVEARRYFERAFKLFQKHRDVAGMFLAWSGVSNTFIYEWDDFSPLDRWIASLETILKRRPKFPSPEIESHVVFGMLTALMYRQPSHRKLPFWAERARTIMLSSSDIQLRMMIGHHLVLYHTWWTGDLAKARAVINALRPLARTPGIAPLTLILWYATEAIYYWMTASPEDCLKAVEEGLEISKTAGVHLWDFMLFAQGVWGSLTANDTARAGEFLSRMSSALDPGRASHGAIYNDAASIEALWRNDITDAREHARIALEYALKSGMPFAQAMCNVSMARAEFGKGEQTKAREHLATASRIGSKMNSAFITYLCLMIEAYFALERGKVEACVKALKAALSLGKRQGLANHMWLPPAALSRLYAQALEAGIEVEYVRDMIQRRGLIPEMTPQEIEQWPWAIKIYTLGRFSLFKDGRPLRFTVKAQHKPIEMLKALIAFGGRDVGAARLASALWPGAEGDAAQRAFDITLHRLRKLLGYDKAIELRDGQVTLDSRYCWVDIWAFERLLQKAEESGSPVLLEKALAGYRGGFLGQGAEQSWAIPLRDRLRSKFLRHTQNLCRQWEASEAWAKAAECYQKGLEIDPLVEQFYQRLMVVYRSMGRRTEALAVYQQCRKTLAAALAVEPSPETEAIHSSLRNKR